MGFFRKAWYVFSCFWGSENIVGLPEMDGDRKNFESGAR